MRRLPPLLLVATAQMSALHTNDADAAVSARRRLSINFIEVAKLVASEAAADDYFGNSVAIDGGTVVVGATGDESFRGAVYVVHTTDGGAAYGQVAKLAASDAAA